MRLVYPALHGRATRPRAGRFGGPERMAEPATGFAVVPSTTAGGSHASWWSSLAHRHSPADHPAPVLLRLSPLRQTTGSTWHRPQSSGVGLREGTAVSRPFAVSTRPLPPAAARGPG